MTKLLYKTPPPHRTHHDAAFVLSPGTFAFDLSMVLRNYRRRIASYAQNAKKQIVGAGEKNERKLLAVAIAELEAIPETEQRLCPDSVAATFANAMGHAVYERFFAVHCETCDREYTVRDLHKAEWRVENGDGSGSSGSRLTCPGGHVLYATIDSVID